MEKTADLIKKFESLTLPKWAWTHEAHLSVCLGYLFTHPYQEIPALLRENIKSYNVAVGGKNTDTSGYHETITMFWLCTLKGFIEDNSFTDADHALTVLLETPISKTDYPSQFYSKDLIGTVEARKNWVKPDLKEYDTYGLMVK